MLALTLVFDEGDDVATCGECVGRGSMDGRDCARCLGAGVVDCNRTAHALVAWRWLRERSREADGLLGLADVIETRWRERDWRHGLTGLHLDALLVDVPLVIDTLVEAAHDAGTLRHAGPASWLVDRWAGAITLRGPRRVGDHVEAPTAFLAAQRAFWREVCPGVVDFLRPAVQSPLPLFDRWAG